MISGRQYYEMPPAGQAMASAYSGIRRFDPDYGLDYGHDKYGFEYGYQTDYRSAASRAVPGTGAAGARQSLSALDEKRANEIRRGVYAHVFLDVKNSNKSDASNPRAQQHKRRRASASPAASYNYNAYDDDRLGVPGRLAPRPAIAASVKPPASASLSSPVMTASHGTAPDYFGAPPDLYHYKGQHFTMTQALSTPRASRLSYTLQAAPMDPKLVFEAMPTSLSRPRRLSQSSIMTATSINSSRDSLETRSRSSSYSSSRTSIDSKGSGMWRPDYMYQRPSQMTVFRKKAKPGEIFAKLPGEVLGLILGELKKAHLDNGSQSCATCWMRDLCSVSLTARRWCRFARVALYEDIQLVGADSASQKKRHKLTFGTRMMLLRRTLRANPYLAGIVHTVKVPSPPAGIALEDYHNQVAALIMACPHFERLVGLHPQYDHSFSKLTHALSTRKQLKHMDWIVEPSPYQRQHRLKSSSGGNAADLAQSARDYSVNPGDLQPYQSATFLEWHAGWANLTTLTVHCLPGATLTPDNLISLALKRLTSLQHLFLSRMPVAAFNDSTLLSLPPLRTLSLTHVPGVSSSGISALATLPTSQAIQRLTLRHISLDSLPALARLFSNFTHLEAFTLVQAFAPTLPEDTFIWLMPYLASHSLRKLHWDITGNTTRANAADSILARSIAAGGFPSLRSLRAPSDPEGIFQALCRPQDRTDSATDRFRGPNGPARSSSFPTPGVNPPVSLKKRSRSSTAPVSPEAGNETYRECSNLHVARLAAQARLEAARALPRFFVNVVDEDGTVLEKHGLAGFIGTVESRIKYNLWPDAGAKDERGGLVEMADLMADNGEDVAASGRDGCQGRWNASPTLPDKKDKDRWWHTERGRWYQPELA